jgi:hypothetical protein
MMKEKMKIIKSILNTLSHFQWKHLFSEFKKFIYKT